MISLTGRTGNVFYLNPKYITTLGTSSYAYKNPYTIITLVGDEDIYHVKEDLQTVLDKIRTSQAKEYNALGFALSCYQFTLNNN